MNKIPSFIPGCFEITTKKFQDHRGAFVKVYNEELFQSFELEVQIKEQYYSTSRKGVLRGMHFQIPPHDHVKIVYCTEGEVFDVVVDLRRNSPTYGKYQEFILNADKGNILYIPKGLAHGFCVLSETATMVYNVTSGYSPESDRGVHWNSIGIEWPIQNPIVSNRDDEFLTISEFKSPFYYEEL